MYKNKVVEIVSLGINCLPRTLLTRGEIKPTKAQGELSCPFDLVKHNLDRIIHYIENDFEDYFDDLYFTLRKRNFLDFRQKGLWKKTDETIFFHDKDCKRNDKKILVERIKRRIENFKNIISSDAPILFVLNLVDSPEKIDELYKILKRKVRHKKFKIIIFDIGEIIQHEIKNDDIYVLSLPLPFNKYQNDWNTKRWRDSKLGKYFELLICRYVQKIIEKDFIQS